MRATAGREFGRIACDPPGSARVFFTKTLLDTAAVNSNAA